MALIYQVKSRTWNQDRQKWQVSVSVYQPNPQDALAPSLISEFDNVALDTSDPSESTIKLTCHNFLTHVENAISSGTLLLVNKMIDGGTGTVIG